MTTGRSVLFIAEFNDAGHAHATQQRRALERLGARVATFDLNARPSFLERFRAGDLAKRLERVLEDQDPELVLVIGGDPLDEALVDRLRGRSRARWINWLPDDLRTVSSATVLARPYDHIYAIGTDVSAEIHERIGRTVDVLVDGPSPSRNGMWVGRVAQQGYEVDGVTHVRGGDGVATPVPGTFARVRITKARHYDLEGEVVA